MSAIQTSKQYRYLSAFLAFLLWGGWAFFVNDGGDSLRGIISGITQGSYSFIATLLMTHFITFQYNKLPNGILKIALPPVITVSITGVVLILIHTMVGTPEILVTVSPVLTVAFLFSLFTSSKLHLASQIQDKINEKQ